VTDHFFDSPDALALTAEEIEAAYERALSAMESVEVAVETLGVAIDPASDTPIDFTDESQSGTAAATSAGSCDHSQALADPPPLLHPREVIEAALFVGGKPLTTRRLSQMLGDRESPETIQRSIEELNRQYSAEERPYQIDFGEGGFRLVLRQEFAAVRNAVFGTGPKEVRLSQDALEVLAFVAYRQPTTLEDLKDAGKENANGLLRQLLRRQLIVLQHTDPGDVCYSTTPRFLELFGLRSLDELPFPDDLELK
jgi:segregation and condensation protein B